MAKKQVLVESLKPGMYVVNFDRPWMDTPFLTHRFLIKNTSQLQKIHQAGIRFVEIDTDHGLDVDPLAPETGDAIPQSDSQILSESHLEQIPEISPHKSLSNELAEVREAREQVLHEVKDMLSNIRTSGMVNSGHAKDVAQEIINQTIGHEQAHLSLIQTREFSQDLYEHSLSVCTLSVLLGSVLDYDKKALHNLAMGALLHDVGLLSLPLDLIRPVRLMSVPDLTRYHQHPELGFEVLKKSQGIPDQVMQIVAEHHFTISPDRGATPKSPQDYGPSSRLIRVIDEYDELLTGQGIQESLPVREALGQLYQLGLRQAIDLQITSHLIAQIGIYPLYSLVELNTGERGIVTSVAPGNLLQPMVLVIQDPEHRSYQEPIPVNFSTPQIGNQHLEIVNVLDAEKEGIKVEEVLADWVAL
ncbi:MAG: DUF3391 domain-containing protein [Nitrospirota bacterium]|nr:DUF3391 domain-containing protein [Nitrospirota bacterium]